MLSLCLLSLSSSSLARPRRRGPVNGDECYFWRTTGCHFGDKCRYKHIPDQKGKDRKPWQPWTLLSFCPSSVQETGMPDWAKGAGAYWTRFSGLRILSIAEWIKASTQALRQGEAHMCHKGLGASRFSFQPKTILNNIGVVFVLNENLYNRSPSWHMVT